MKSARGARLPPHGLGMTIADGVAWLRLERPRAGNRITPALAQALCAAAAEIELDDRVAVVVVSAAGEDFCLGVEDGGDWEKRVDWVDAVGRLTPPVVAAVQGDAVGEGMELALACDLRVVSERARFAMPQLAAGRLPRHGGTQRLPRLVGRMRALDLLFTGRPVAAREAAAIGLASRLAAPRTLRRAVHAVAGELRAKAPVALRYVKEAVRAGSDLTFDQGTRLEEDLYVLLQTTGDRREGIEAFLHKRRPAFRGR